MRLEETNEDWQKMKGLAEDFDNARKKKINEIEEQYRKENPNATDRSKQPLKPPFEMMLGEVANQVIKELPKNERAEATKKVQEWRQKYADLLAWEQTIQCRESSLPKHSARTMFCSLAEMKTPMSRMRR